MVYCVSEIALSDVKRPVWNCRSGKQWCQFDLDSDNILIKYSGIIDVHLLPVIKETIRCCSSKYWFGRIEECMTPAWPLNWDHIFNDVIHRRIKPEANREKHWILWKQSGIFCSQCSVSLSTCGVNSSAGFSLNMQGHIKSNDKIVS